MTPAEMPYDADSDHPATDVALRLLSEAVAVAGGGSPDGPKRVVAKPLDASALVDIWLDGFTSGAATAALAVNGGDAADADEFSDRVVAKLVGDPAAMEGVRREVKERISGIKRFSRTWMPCPPSTLLASLQILWSATPCSIRH